MLKNERHSEVAPSAPGPDTPQPAAPDAAEVIKEDPLTAGKRLEEYVRLRSRVLMSNDERLRKLEILEDPRFLEALGRLLRDGASSQQEGEAIRALLEARRFAESATADRVLGEIVADPRVEDEALPQSQREDLAATKAEVMYLWAAESQEVASKIPQHLPGRISEGLWRNVQTLHHENALASNEIGERYTRTGSHLNE